MPPPVSEEDARRTRLMRRGRNNEADTAEDAEAARVVPEAHPNVADEVR